MAQFGLSIAQATDSVEILRVLRRYTDDSIAKLRTAIENSEIVLDVSEFDYPIEMGMIEGTKHQQARFLRACEELRTAGASPSYWYWVLPESKSAPESVTEAMVHNLMAAHLEDLQQEHD